MKKEFLKSKIFLIVDEKHVGPSFSEIFNKFLPLEKNTKASKPSSEKLLKEVKKEQP